LAPWKILAMSNPPRKSLFRSLGEFVGHITKAVKTDPARPATRTQRLDERVEEHEATDEAGRRIVLRRTTIDEVEYPDKG
jgi:hypothetical protein